MAKQIKVREDNYFAVQGWMVTELKLKGNALMLYAIIYGFSQTTNTAFTGSVDYLCEWLGGVSRPTIINTLDNLVKQGLLTKSSTTKGALIYNSYTALRPSKKILSDEDPTSKKTLPDTSKNFLLNKDSKDNIEKSISKEMEGKAPKKRSYSTILEDPVNKFVKEALSKFIQYCRGKNYTPKVTTVEKFASTLRDNAGEDPVVALAIVDQSIDKGWKDLYPLNRNFEYVFDVGIPKINPNYIGTYDTNLHEEMHFLDMLITVKDNKDRLPSKMFSQSYKPLVEAFDKATPVIGDKAKKLFEDFAKECDIIYKKQQETFNTQHEDLKEQYRSGKIDWKKYNSLYKKLSKEVNEEADNERRALFGGGVSGLQDIYDAVSKGTFRDTGQVTYGHGSAYYTDRRKTNTNCSESLANYASLCVGHPELIDILAEDYPEIVTALRGCVEAMLKEVPK